MDDFGKPLPGREPPSAPAPAHHPPLHAAAAATNTEADGEGRLYRQPTPSPAVEGRGPEGDERRPLLSGAQNEASSKDRLRGSGRSEGGSCVMGVDVYVYLTRP